MDVVSRADCNQKAYISASLDSMSIYRALQRASLLWPVRTALTLFAWVIVCTSFQCHAQSINLLPRQADTAHNNSVVDGANGEGVTNNVTQTGSTDAPKFQLTPYIWFSGFSGDLAARGNVVKVDAKFSEIIDELNFGFTSIFEARLGENWRFLADINYLNLSDDKGTPGPLFDGVQVTAKTLIIDPEIGYNFTGKKGFFSVMGGFRLWHLENKLELRRGANRLRASQVQTWADPVVGFRLKAGRRAFVILKADIGGFGLGSELTWQAFGGFGLLFGRRMSIDFGYRHLDVDYRRNGFIYDVAMSGPLVGFGLRF